MRRLAWLLSALALASCGDGHTYLAVTVSSAQPLTLQRFALTLDNAGMTGHASVAPSGGITLPPDQSFAVQLDGRSGDIKVHLDAVAPDGSTVASAEDRATLNAGGTVTLTLRLGPVTTDGGASDGPAPDLAGSCTDGIKNGTETDIDCGGATCPKCLQGKACAASPDCTTGYCNPDKSVCGPASCADKLKDGTESDIDCGGTDCAACPVDKLCAAATDCSTTSCTDGVCSRASGPPSWIATQSTAISSPTLEGAVGPDGKVWIVSEFNTAAGGFLSAPVSTYDPSTNMFTSVTTVPTIRGGVGAVFLPDGRLFVVGGQKYAGPLTVVEAYNKTGAWTTPKPLQVSMRALLGATLGTDGRIYAIAGLSSSTTTSFTAEAYDPKMDTWVEAGQLSQREQLSAATGLDGTIYAIGGYVSSPLGLVEKYNGDGTNFWKQLAPLKTARYLHAATTGPDGRIYVAGGNDGTASLPSVEAYAPAANKWAPAAPLVVQRQSFVLVTLPDGHLLAIGGAAAAGAYIDRVETYGPKITITPANGPAGTTVTIAGGNFAAMAKVEVQLDAMKVASGATDGAGALTAPITFAAPSLPAGAHKVQVMDNRSLFPITLTFTIN